MADAAETVKKTVEQTTAKAKAQAENIQAAGAKAFREGVDKLEWMTPETKKTAKAKAETMLVGVSGRSGRMNSKLRNASMKVPM